MVLDLRFARFSFCRCHWGTEKAHQLFQHKLFGPHPKHPVLGQQKFSLLLFFPVLRAHAMQDCRFGGHFSNGTCRGAPHWVASWNSQTPISVVFCGSLTLRSAVWRPLQRKTCRTEAMFCLLRDAPHGVATLKVRKGAVDALNKWPGAFG